MQKPKKYKASHVDSGIKKYSIPSKYDTYDWASFRVRFIAANPKCYACGEKARVVDHWQAHKGDDKLFWKADNYIPLCSKCHGYVTAKFDKSLVPDVVGKLNWLNQKRLETNTNTSVKVIPLDC